MLFFISVDTQIHICTHKHICTYTYSHNNITKCIHSPQHKTDNKPCRLY